MKLERLILRCYAERDSDGTWFAMCVDLNIYARADNFVQVKGKLRGFVVDYVREALTRDADYIESLIPRRAPFVFWLRYLRAVLFTKLHQVATQKRFRLPLPLVPA